MTDITVFEPDGRAIPYADEGSGPGVVLVPGMGLNIRYLGPLAGALTEEDFRIVRIGARTARAEGLSLHDLAQDVVDVMDHIGLGGAWIGGHSFGGVVARTVALDHPERVGGVLLLAVDTDPQAVDADLSELPENARDTDLEAMQRAAWLATPEAEWADLTVGAPVLVIQGAEDRITPPANGAALQAQAPHRVSVVGIEGAGHLFPATHIGETAWPIEDYLDWD